MLDQQMSMAYVTVTCGEVAVSDTHLRERMVYRTQEIVLKFQLVASSGEYWVEAASGCSGWIIFWLCGISLKCTTVLPIGEGKKCCAAFIK